MLTPVGVSMWRGEQVAVRELVRPPKSERSHLAKLAIERDGPLNNALSFATSPAPRASACPARPIAPNPTMSQKPLPQLPANDANEIVPDSVIPHGTFPPLRYRDLPEVVPARKMIGPSIILAGLALGSGEFILWPNIVYHSQFVFFWACLLGVGTQYFLNMEITRWTLATGESAITGFCRLSKHWAWIFLIMNIVPWMIPAWAKGAADLGSWLIFGVEHTATGGVTSPFVFPLAIAGLVICGGVLTAGPVVYETVEKVQGVLVTGIVLMVIVLACLLVRWDAVVALAQGAVSIGQLPSSTNLTAAMLLGALAFAGAGGTVNLGQSNYIKDKGYGMGAYIGRITSPLTGQEEPAVEVGYHFRDTELNRARWKKWWQAASIEHFFSFFVTCVVCLVLLTLICYSVFYTPEGTLANDVRTGGKNDLSFISDEADGIAARLPAAGDWARPLFLIMGIAILLTTEFGLLDVCSRISTDIVKANWLRDNPRWTQSRLYYLFLWSTIVFGVIILALAPGTLAMFEVAASLNGVVMFLYSGLLLYLNRRALPPGVRMSLWRCAILGWSVLFFGFFTVWMIGGWIQQMIS